MITPRTSTESAPRRDRRWLAARALVAGIALSASLAISGCAPPPMKILLGSDMQRGRFAEARRALLPIVSDTSLAAQESREFLLDRMRLGMATLADGQPELAEPVMFETFLQLRRQGINDDATVEAGIFGERGVIFWKGEPFEQAYAYASIAQNYAMLGQWDNARAAALNSLFLLKNFGEKAGGQRKSTEDIAREAARSEKQRPGSYDEYLKKAYRPTKTNFALGYLLAGCANWALGARDRDRANEAGEQFADAVEVLPSLRPVTDAIITGNANTILVVEYGAGPEKSYREGNTALAVFRQLTRSDGQALALRINGLNTENVPQACDVNALAADHMWNNFEDIRSFKRVLGDVLIAGGAVRAASRQRIDGYDLAAVAIGLLIRESAKVDLRYCDTLPQRVYVAAINVPGPGTNVELSVPGDPAASIVLHDLAPPLAGERLQLRSVRLLSGGFSTPLANAVSLIYGNDYSAEHPPGDDLPYILGGTSVRVPTDEALTYYQSRGRLMDYTLVRLQNLYREEGLGWDANNPRIQNAVHVLDGGSSMIPPVAGTTGYTRLFYVPHGPYAPKSAALKAARAELGIFDPTTPDPNRSDTKRSKPWNKGASR